MDQLPRLNVRLSTLGELRGIVRALRAMAANATREGEAALLAVQRCSEVIDAAVADGLDLVAELVGRDVQAIESAPHTIQASSPEPAASPFVAAGAAANFCQRLMAKVMRALMESSVVENATRLRILTNADRKIDEKMEALRQEARRLRQQSITAELLDILIGAEASEFDR